MTGTIRVRAASGATIPPTDAIAAAVPADAVPFASIAVLAAAVGLLAGVALARRRLLA